jgi:hypothetical protein
MKTRYILLSVLLVALLVSGCNIINLTNGRNITPSDVIVTETRDVSGFTGVTISTLGKVVISQGDTESLTISGSDNLVPLIKTSVTGGVLLIEMQENINITNFTNENMLTYTIVVKDLASLTVSGLADAQIDTLTTDSVALSMSGAGQIKLGQLNARNLDVTISGLGNVDVAGEVTTATINISGAGNVNAPDLKIQTAEVNIPGLGGAKIWVTDQLSGTISGGGDVSYYGDPQTSVNTTGLGAFKPLGSK